MKSFLIYATSILLVTACNSTSTNTDKKIADSTDAKNSSNTMDSTKVMPPPADVSLNPDMTEFAAEVDADKDGKMTKAEWKTKGLPESSFKGFEKGRGYVTIDDYTKNPAPPGIDINKDGKLTVKEFLQFDKEMSKKMPPPPSKK